MRAVLQRVSRARVTVDGEVVGELTRPGLLALVGVTHDDGPEQVATMIFAMAHGVALERLLDPKAVPDGLLPEMMAVFFSGLRARAAAGPAPAPPEASR